MGNLLDIAKSDQFIGQQTKRPVLASGRWSRASQSQQVGFNLPVQFALSPAGRAAAMQCCVQTLFDEALTDAMNGLATDIEGVFDSFVSPSRTMWTAIGFKQDLGMGTHTGAGCTVIAAIA